MVVMIDDAFYRQDILHGDDKHVVANQTVPVHQDRSDWFQQQVSTNQQEVETCHQVTHTKNTDPEQKAETCQQETCTKSQAKNFMDFTGLAKKIKIKSDIPDSLSFTNIIIFNLRDPVCSVFRSTDVTSKGYFNSDYLWLRPLT